MWGKKKRQKKIKEKKGKQNPRGAREKMAVFYANSYDTMSSEAQSVENCYKELLSETEQEENRKESISAKKKKSKECHELLKVKTDNIRLLERTQEGNVHRKKMQFFCMFMLGCKTAVDFAARTWSSPKGMEATLE